MGQLTLYHCKLKKGDDVADDEDSDVVRTCVSQDQVTEHFVSRNSSSGLSIYSSLNISDRWNVGVGDTDSQHHTFSGPS